mmetsp:Transcript_6612/g.16028  ORF Transcript_6612/g.16028 Transcript_6612/m.16028 type:complete len:98 (+) Transcript_6612:1047-1340(+)
MRPMDELPKFILIVARLLWTALFASEELNPSSIIPGLIRMPLRSQTSMSARKRWKDWASGTWDRLNKPATRLDPEFAAVRMVVLNCDLDERNGSFES